MIRVTSVGRLILIILIVCSPIAFSAAGGTGLSTAIAVDSVGTFKVVKDSKASDSFDIREAEISMYAPIDHLFDGVLSMAAHKEAGGFIFELHEATIGSTKLIPRTSFRVGKYFLGIGRLNRFHRHDWPFVSAPKVFSEFFGTEGVLDSGGEVSYLLPTPFFLNVNAGVTNGWVYGHSHDKGKKPKSPTHYARVSTFFESSYDMGVYIGGNYLGRTSADGTKMQLLGLDGVAKWSSKGFNELMIQGEAWQRSLKPEKGDKEISIGAYLYPQMGFSKNIYAGFRFDYFSLLSLKDAIGKKIKNSEYALVPTITYKSSEFATFKLGYTYSVSTQENKSDEINKYIEVQSTFILGAHPAHDF